MSRRILILVLIAAAFPFAAPPASGDTSLSSTVFAWPRRSDARATGGSFLAERTRGASATLRFTGTRAVWFTIKGPKYGRARIYLDGAFVRSVNNHADSKTHGVTRRVKAARPGRHVLRIVVAGKAGAPGGGRWVAVDGFRVDGVDVSQGEAIYRWDLARTNEGLTRRSSAGGARSSFAFTGKGLDVLLVAGPWGGRARIVLDGAVKDTIDTYAPEPRALVVSFAGLTDDEHVATVVATGAKRRISRGRMVSLHGWVVRRPSVRAFRRLGTWIDLWEYDLDPAQATATMAEHGVRTLYLQTARYTSDSAFPERAQTGAWLEAAHAAGIKVVGWYLPRYGKKLRTDIHRTAKIASFRSAGGHAFDALAVDIEHTPGGPGGDEFNSGIRRHLRAVRHRVGNRFPIGAIIPSVVAMDHLNSSYAGFPYAPIGRYADAVLPMGYWSYRTEAQCASDEIYCALGYTRENTARAGARTGLPVHIIGGIANEVSGAEVDDFVTGAEAARAAGGSLYDFNTMRPGLWPRLAPLND